MLLGIAWGLETRSDLSLIGVRVVVGGGLEFSLFSQEVNLCWVGGVLDVMDR